MRALLTETDVERIFLDRGLQRLLYAHALEEGEDRDWLDDVFGRLGDEERKGVIQHERKHKNHLHVRFFNRVAQERARVVYPTLVETGSVPPPMVKHRVRRGETLGHLAARYGTSVVGDPRGERAAGEPAARGARVPDPDPARARGRRADRDPATPAASPATQAVDSTTRLGHGAPAVAR